MFLGLLAPAIAGIFRGQIEIPFGVGFGWGNIQGAVDFGQDEPAEILAIDTTAQREATRARRGKRGNPADEQAFRDGTCTKAASDAYRCRRAWGEPRRIVSWEEL